MIDRVARAIDDQWPSQIEFLQSLVRCPSTLFNEAQIQNLIGAKLGEMGLAVDRWEIDPGQLKTLPGYAPVEWSYHGRPNLVGTLSAAGTGGRSLLLNGHIDVVSAEPVHFWSHDPWGGEVVHDRMYGRGAADMKAGVAAMIYAVEAIQRCGIKLRGDLLLNTVIEEECTGAGALATIARGYTADAVLIPEPFGQTALEAQVGVLWARISVRGAGAHVRSADSAVNAVLKSIPLIEAIRELEAEVNRDDLKPAQFKELPHPINYNIGTFHAGDWPSTVPAEAVLEVRLGCYPGEDLEIVKQRFRERVHQVAARDPWLREHQPEISFYGFHADGWSTDRDQEIFRVLGEAHRAVTGNEIAFATTTATTDVRFFALYKQIPTTCYGPAGDGLHAADEWVDLKSVNQTTKVIARFIMTWCGAEENSNAGSA